MKKNAVVLLTKMRSSGRNSEKNAASIGWMCFGKMKRRSDEENAVPSRIAEKNAVLVKGKKGALNL